MKKTNNQPIGSIAELATYQGPAFRVEIENWGIPEKATAADVVRFETEELGNQLEIPETIIKELEKYSHNDVVWVTKTKKAAIEYLSEGMSEKDISLLNVSGGKIITGDDYVGYLVLRPNAKPIKGDK
jgi:hypothetical protein